ncbi:MAG: AAA family ATPase [Cyanobacteria bacterium J06631_9]
MAKNAEDRYQSALGLKHDLEECLYQLKDWGHVDAFELGSQDVCDRFLLPEKLYGRQIEVARLLAAFERTSQGSTEIMLVAGHSGIGKTAVVNEVHKPITRQNGYFITGKYDQLQRNIPLSAFIQAFRALMKLILGESDAQLENWRRKILAALGENSQILIDVIPELSRILGPQPPVAALPGNAAENRFNLIMQKFVKVFSGPQHPLVIFLDDLQWADAASLKLMQLLMQDNGHLFLIGAYRNNEVSPGHPLMLALEEMREPQRHSNTQPNNNNIHQSDKSDSQYDKSNVNTLLLTTLSETDLNHLVADTLHSDLEFARPLSSLIYQKTGGNPFFSSQFLTALQSEGKITFSEKNHRWEYDLTTIRQTIQTDNVVEFMGLQLQKLPPESQKAVKIAACIGAQFDLVTLAIAAETPIDKIAQDLWQAIQEGLIIPTDNSYKVFINKPTNSSAGTELNSELYTQLDSEPIDSEPTDSEPNSEPQNNKLEENISEENISEENIPDTNPTYRFLHDRVQQAAYGLIDAAQQEKTHYAIGQRLLQRSTPEQKENNLFDIVNHLNRGRSLITTETEKAQLLKLNLRAGQKAQATVAYAAALEYFITSISLLPVGSWQTIYGIALTLYNKAAETALLTGDLVTMQQYIDIISEQGHSLLDKSQAYEIQLQAAISQEHFLQSIEVAREVLSQLDIHLPRQVSAEDNQKRLLVLSDRLSQYSAEDILNQPAINKPQTKVIIRLIGKAVEAAYVAQPELLPVLICIGIDHCLEEGNSALSSFLYSWYGVLLCSQSKGILQGQKMGDLALRLLEKYPSKEIHTRVITLVEHLIRPWQTHIKYSLAPLKKNYQLGLEHGDSEYAALSACLYSLHAYLAGHNLNNLATKIGLYRDGIQQQQAENAFQHISLSQQVAFNLLGLSDSPIELEGEAYSEANMLPMQLAVNDVIGLSTFFTQKGILATLFGDYSQGLKNFSSARRYLKGIASSPLLPALAFYESLAYLARYAAAEKSGEGEKGEEGEEDRDELTQVSENQRQLALWAEHAPANYRHRWHLVEAEWANCQNNKAAALDHYDQAIALAQANEFVQEEAIAHELAGQFYLQWGKPRAAQGYIIDAYYAYSRWGAKAKVNDLEERYPKLLGDILQQTNNIPASGTIFAYRKTHSSSTNSTGVSEAIDLSTLLHTSQALSSEIELEKLLTTLLDAAIKNAGADKCILLMPKELAQEASTGHFEDKAPDGAQAEAQTKENSPSKSTDSIEEQPWVIEAFSDLASLPILLQSQPITTGEYLPSSLINHVKHTLEAAVIFNATAHPTLCNDPYVLRYKPKSVLCIPIVNQGKLISILYLENNLTIGAFTDNRVEVLKLICTQAAISLENARLYHQTQQALEELQSSHMQLVQSEKMSALGNLVAGVAHEINNPINFLQGNLKPALNYVQDLMGILELVKDNEPREVILDEMEEVDLDFIREDLPNLLQSMTFGISRIRDISTSLRTFSRADKEYKTAFNLHDGIDSTLLILKHRLRSDGKMPSIEVVKDYGALPDVKCFAGQINQVFMNLIANAIDALEEMNEKRDISKPANHTSKITITTALEGKQAVRIVIADNGTGMSETVQSRIFDHLFTTKAVGKGTGLGLAISHAIIVEKHSGTLSVNSKIGQGTEFVITLPIVSDVEKSA